MVFVCLGKVTKLAICLQEIVTVCFSTSFSIHVPHEGPRSKSERFWWWTTTSGSLILGRRRWQQCTSLGQRMAINTSKDLQCRSHIHLVCALVCQRLIRPVTAYHSGYRLCARMAYTILSYGSDNPSSKETNEWLSGRVAELKEKRKKQKKKKRKPTGRCIHQ